MDTAQRLPDGSDAEQTEIQELISTLPRFSDGIFRRPLHKYTGFWFFPLHLEGTLIAQRSFVAQPVDIMLCSSPKTGTTWLKALVFATANRAQYNVESSSHPLLTGTPHDCVRNLELQPDMTLNPHRRFRILSSHVPYSLLPDSVRSSTCKIVYVWRDPKDMLVSYMHFVSGVELGKGLHTNAIPVDQACSQFIEGIFPYGPYWNHVIEFLRASQERPGKVLCLRYEDLADKTSDCVRRLAEFISQPFSPEEEERGMVDKIVDLCSFENLQGLETNREGEYRRRDGQLVIQNALFYRKGKVGDWKNHLPNEQAARLDEIFLGKIAEAGLKLPA